MTFTKPQKNILISFFIVFVLLLVVLFLYLSSLDNCKTAKEIFQEIDNNGQNIFDEYCTSTKPNVITCTGPFVEFGCDTDIHTRDDQLEYLKGLEPNYPILPCKKSFSDKNDTGEGVTKRPGEGLTSAMKFITDYVVYKDNQFELITSPEQFIDTFGPVDSEEEALAFVVAFQKGFIAADSQPLKELEYGKYGKFLVDRDKIQATSVKKVFNGFLVNVYTSLTDPMCDGYVAEKVLLIKRNGEIIEKESRKIWNDDFMGPPCIY